jgi:hypothetical protein
MTPAEFEAVCENCAKKLNAQSPLKTTTAADVKNAFALMFRLNDMMTSAERQNVFDLIVSGVPKQH